MGDVKTALVVVASGSEDIEFVTPVDVLRRAKVEVTTASVEDTEKVVLSSGNVFLADKKINDVKDSEFDVIIIPGGLKGSKTIAKCDVVVHKLQEQKKVGKFYAAICAAPKIVFEPHKLLDGVVAVAYPGFDLACGPVNSRVCVSEKCVTSLAPGSALEFSLKIVELLVGKEVANTVAKQLVVHPSCTF